MASKITSGIRGDNDLAKKYCLKVTVPLLREGVVIGRLVKFNVSIQASAELEHACEAFKGSQGADTCGPAEIVLYPECPVEITDDILYIQEETL